MLSFFLSLLFWLQTPAAALERVQVELWPDYDQPSLLVLISGDLPAGTPLPAEVTVPLLPGARLNAVARIRSDGTMIDDVTYRTSPDGQQLTLTTPDLSFRVEYYVPYTADGDERRFTFTWTAETPVNQFRVSVQQPTAATNLTTTPAGTPRTGFGGLQYTDLPAQALALGDSYQVQVRYTTASGELSAPSETAAFSNNVVDTPAAAEGNSASSSTLRWVGIGAGAVVSVGLIGYGVYMLAQSRRPVEPVRPTRARPGRQATAGGAVRFCHQCGQSVQPGDRFCRNCGTAVKQR
ncbi:MAG: zinc ribbon domain-containing protein [Chloroflexota bacterium]